VDTGRTIAGQRISDIREQNNSDKKTTNSKPIPHIAAVQGSDSGRAQGEAANKKA
jgi:hypothetical protein